MEMSRNKNAVEIIGRLSLTDVTKRHQSLDWTFKQQKGRKFDSSHLKCVLICCGTENVCEGGATPSAECFWNHHFFNRSLEFACLCSSVVIRFIKAIIVVMF